MNPLLCANMFNSTKRASFFPAILSILALCYLTEAAMPRIPASVVVPRASPDVTSHKTEIPQFIFLLTFLAILMTFFMAARIYARGILRRNMGWDDWTMLAAWVLILGNSANLAYQTAYGLGLHMIDFDMRYYVPTTIAAYAYKPPYTVGITLTKISICLAYLRLFPNRTSNVWLCRIAIAYCAAFGIALAFLYTFMCAPVSDFWAPLDQEVHCLPDHPQVTIATIMNATANVIAFLWAIRFLRGLKLPAPQRLQLVAMFTCGCCVSLVALARLWFRLGYYMQIDRRDVQFIAARSYMFTTAETNLGVICGCAPFCKPALARLFPRLSAAASPKTPAPPPALPASRGGGRPDAFSDFSLLRSAGRVDEEGVGGYPAVAPRVLQHPPDVDLRAVLAAGRVTPVAHRQERYYSQGRFGNLTAV